MEYKQKILIWGVCLLISACGVKPGSVSAPEGSENNQYPRTYPNIQNDPQPE